MANFSKNMEEPEKIKIKHEETCLNKPARDERGRLLPGNCGNPNGRPVLSEEEKLRKKAEKKATEEYIAEYLERLTEALPLISPVLIEKAQTGDVSAIKELHDRVMGKATQPIKMSGGVDLTVLEQNIKQIANGGVTTENSKDGSTDVQGRGGKTIEANGEPVSDIPTYIQQAIS